MARATGSTLAVLARQPRATVYAAAAVVAAGGLLSLKWHRAVKNKRLASGVLRAYRALVDDAASVSDGDENGPSDGRNAAKCDVAFIKNLVTFLRVCIPGVPTKEAGLMVVIAALLGARSYLDLWASSNGGHVVKAIVSQNKANFLRYAVRDIGIMMMPMAFVNNSLRYCLSRLKVLMRRRLSHFFHDKYLANNTFYKISNLDARIRNIDQLLTVDVERFCSSLAELYTNISKPSIDIILFSRKLARTLGPEGPFLMIAYFVLCSVILRSVQPPFGQLTSDEQKLEGEYRLHHSRLIVHSEEIAFYGGGEREKIYINRAFDQVMFHLYRVFNARWRIGFIDSLLVKYVATIVGYTVVSIPVFFRDAKFLSVLFPRFLGRTRAKNVNSYATSAKNSADSSDIAGDYTRNSRLLLQLAGAIGRLVLAGKEITRLTGYAQRVATLRDVLDDLSQQNAVRKRFESSPDLERDMRLSELMKPGKLIVGSEDEGPDSNVVRFVNVNLISPDSVPLVTGLTLAIPRGCHVLVTGPNGSGKSSMFRVLAGLWPLYGGVLYRPANSRIFYVPQRPYLALGSLRENVTYPMTWRDAVEQRGATDASIIQILEQVHLGDIVRRKGGLDAVQDWAEVLSGGQKQRLGFSRLLFNRPDYAILDECTSAVSLDVEGLLYAVAKQVGITLISVSHRPSLWKFHDRRLAFDGEGGYEFREILPQDIPSLTGEAKE